MQKGWGYKTPTRAEDEPRAAGWEKMRNEGVGSSDENYEKYFKDFAGTS